MTIAKRKEALASRSLKISCVIPLHNEEENAQHFIEELTTTLKTITDHIELIAIDDGSTDNTAQILTKLTHTHPLKLLRLSRNFGKETALTAGLDQATGDVTLLIDADFQHPLACIPVFLEHWTTGYDMVYGVRKERKTESRLKRMMTRIFYGTMNLISQVNLPANAGDFRLLDRKVLNALQQFEERERFMKGLYAWVGFKSLAVPFDVAERREGKSSWHLLKLTELAITGFTNFSNIPLRIWSVIGVLVSLTSFLCGLFVIIDTLVFGVDVPGYATIMISIIFFGGLQLLSIGILGEYIAKIFNEVKKRPKYIIDTDETSND